MKIIRFFKIAFAVILISLFAVACDARDENVLLSEQNEFINNIDELKRSSSELRSSITGRDNYDFYLSPSTFKMYLGKRLRLSARARTSAMDPGEVIHVKYLAPTGQEVIVPMNNTYNDGKWRGFLLDRVLQLTGKYRIQYGLMRNGVFDPIPLERTDNQHLNFATTVIPVKIPLGNDYDPTNRSTAYDGYCTAWVAWKVNQMWNVRNKFPSKGDADSWLVNLEKLGYKAGSVPQVGDIAYWKAYDRVGELGHVAFVNEVIDRDHVVVSEFNLNGRYVYSERHLYRSGGKYQFPTKFIHVQVPID